MDWIEELRASLLRAGDHIAENKETLYWNSPDGGSNVFVYRLWHQLPAGTKAHVTAYIRGFAQAHGWKIQKVTHKKFAIEVTAAPLL